MSAKMRTLPQAMAEIKQSDPHSALTISTLRLLVKRGELPVVHIRNRQLIDMDTLAAYLKGTGATSTPMQQTVETSPERGVIRKISER